MFAMIPPKASSVFLPSIAKFPKMAKCDSDKCKQTQGIPIGTMIAPLRVWRRVSATVAGHVAAIMGHLRDDLNLEGEKSDGKPVHRS